MDRRVARRRPATATSHVSRVVAFPDDNAPAGSILRRKLRVAPLAKVRIRLYEQLAIDGTMRRMARRATFAQRFVFKDSALRLRAMTTGALLIQPRHGQTARRLHDFPPVRIVALHAVHLPFANRMVLRKVELSVDFQVASKTGLRIAAGIHNKFSAPAADSNVLAAGPVT